MDLVHGVKIRRGVRGEQIGHSRRESGADHDVAAGVCSPSAEQPERLDILDGVAHRHDVCASGERPCGERSMAARIVGDQHGVDRFCSPVRHDTGPVAERVHHSVGGVPLRFDDQQLADSRNRHHLTTGAGPNGTDTDDGDAHRYFSSGPDSSRHPPRCGGTPPEPRSRMAAATMAATARENTARRMAFKWG